jgi:RNA polymerase sigma-32 factor
MQEQPNTIKYPIITQEASLTRYLEEIRKFPMLTEEEEKHLALEWYEKQDILAAQKLVTSHLRLVAKIAMQYRGYGLPVNDIISEGTLGLMTAVKKYDPHKGYRLATYAMWWIKANIQDYVLKSWSMVKMGTSAAHKKLFFNLRKIKNRLLHMNEGRAPANEVDLIAKELNVSKEDASDMNDRFTHYEASLNDHAYDEDSVEIIDTIAEPSDDQEVLLLESQELDYKKKKMHAAMLTLNEREQEIIRERRLKDTPTTLEVLSKKFNVSNERIRQIEERALQKLQQAATAA